MTCAEILPHQLTPGHQLPPRSILTEMNDTSVKSLRHAMSLIDQQGQEGLVVLLFENCGHRRIVLDAAEVLEANADILRQNNIGSACPDDLRRGEK
ncbi:MAG: hypothetical protein HYZ53_27385 [Planctomycetes bacterium]|nr:hypothetical protein [Planctomycetota bacterium]